MGHNKHDPQLLLRLVPHPRRIHLPVPLLPRQRFRRILLPLPPLCMGNGPMGHRPLNPHRPLKDRLLPRLPRLHDRLHRNHIRALCHDRELHEGKIPPSHNHLPLASLYAPRKGNGRHRLSRLNKALRRLQLEPPLRQLILVPRRHIQLAHHRLLRLGRPRPLHGQHHQGPVRQIKAPLVLSPPLVLARLPRSRHSPQAHAPGARQRALQGPRGSRPGRQRKPLKNDRALRNQRRRRRRRRRSRRCRRAHLGLERNLARHRRTQQDLPPHIHGIPRRRPLLCRAQIQPRPAQGQALLPPRPQRRRKDNPHQHAHGPHRPHIRRRTRLRLLHP
eukprot:comp22257_c0_seq1/m.52940 comp22257_c0_seq1/g.52940  ORF comp22257_c0_seq1/g.52940 comp22257_c0_seq1/m.52940 type:complete len:332 (-) comp22257_c0_seq1:947-1942(-)